MPAFSVPAAEHSTITSWGKENEAEAYRNMLRQFPSGIVSVVSDSYDIFHAVEKVWGEALREEVLAREGTLVIRPDSGDPATVVLRCCRILAEKFGAVKNGKGYFVINPKVRILQGDGINLASIREILRTLQQAGFSADNLVLGMGGALLQQCNRDTQRFAFKASCATVNGEDRDVTKNPVGDSSKRSKAGRLALTRQQGHWRTERRSQAPHSGDLLQTVFENGEIKTEISWEDIRRRAREGLEDGNVSA
jgi:nicotinamide phosphoribosyltransferase